MYLHWGFVLKRGCLWGLIASAGILLCSLVGMYLLPHP